MDMIPQELKQVRQWTHSYSRGELKRPKHFKYIHNGGLTYEQAKDRSGSDLYIGFYTTIDDPYILIDIDHVQNPKNPFSELPVSLASFIQTLKTYVEISPSGNGLRVICKLPSPTDKQLVQGQIFYITETMGDKRQCQCNFGPPWMTITGNSTPYAFEDIAQVTLNDLAEVFTIRLKDDPSKVEARKKIDVTKLPSLSEISNAIMSIPLDQNPRVQRAYVKTFKQSYAHYDFWVRLLMGLHNYAILANKEIECLELALQWSRTDTESFESEDDVVKHWRSFNEKENEVSYKTIFGVAVNNRLFWPMPKKQTKAEKDRRAPLKPLTTEYSNFESMVDYYNIKMHRDVGEPNIVYLTGDTDILEKYFIVHNVSYQFSRYLGPFVRDTLIPAFHIMCQRIGFVGISHTQITAFVKNLLAKTRNKIDLIKLYFDTPYEDLPTEYKQDECYYESTTFDKLFECLKIDYTTYDHNRELELYKAYYKKWLMGIVRNLYYRDHQQMNNCVLLLTGKEQIRKTSHFKYLFPPFLRHLVAFTTHGFANDGAMRDVVKLSATNLVLVWDELEHYLESNTESNFKKVIDGNPQKIIDKYETVEKIITPIAVYGATSNYREFKLGSEGSRRMFHIPVKWVDTDTMEQICWHKLFTDLKAEVEWGLKSGTVPWLLTDEQLEYQSVLHSSLRSKTSIDMMLEEVFEFDDDLEFIAGGIPGVLSIQTDKSGRMMTTKEVSDTLSRAGFNMMHVKRPALVKTLERLCGQYTRTRNARKYLERPRCEIFRGVAKQKQYKKWVMPPLRQEARDSMFQQFKQFT